MMNNPTFTGIDPESLRRKKMADKVSGLMRLAQIYASTHALVGTRLAEPNQDIMAAAQKAELEDQLTKSFAEVKSMGRLEVLDELNRRGVLVLIFRIEDYEDTHPQLIAEDAINEGWPFEIITDTYEINSAVGQDKRSRPLHHMRERRQAK